MREKLLIERLRNESQRTVEQEVRERLLLALGRPVKPLQAPLFRR